MSKRILKLNKHEKQVPQFYSEIFKLASMPSLLPLFPNIKEWTESLAAFYAVSQHFQDAFSDENVHVACVGDGSTPRTAAMFALRTAWNCFSIDPMLKPKPFHAGIKRLNVVPRKIQDFHLDVERLIIVCVHSHAPVSSTLSSLKATRRSMVFIPCCSNSGKMPDNAKFVYDDERILSEKNKVYVWDQI